MDEAKKQLDFIEEMMSTAKGNLADSSIFYLIWGWLVFIAASTNYYLLEHTDYESHWIAWPYLMGLGGILSVIVGMKKSKEQKVKTKIDKLLQHLCLGFTITMVVMLFGMINLGENATYPVLMALYGLGTFVSGSIISYNPLKIGGVASWVCASIGFYQDNFAHQLILIAAAILFSYIIPGHLLHSKK